TKPSLLLSNPLLDYYTEAFAEIGPVRDLPIELIAEEYRTRHRFGDRPSHSHYLIRFPRHASRLKDSLSRIDAELAERTGVGSPFVSTSVECSVDTANISSDPHAST